MVLGDLCKGHCTHKGIATHRLKTTDLDCGTQSSTTVEEIERGSLCFFFNLYQIYSFYMCFACIYVLHHVHGWCL